MSEARRSLMFVGAHPDDDTFGIARSIALMRSDRSLRFVLVIATDGDAGEVSPDVELTSDLGALRRQEDVDSWATLGRSPDRLEWLGLPDGDLANLVGELSDTIADILEDERPDVVASFGPDGVTGHPDHIAVSRATTDAFHRVRGDGGGLRRLVYSAIPQSQLDRWNTNRRSSGHFEWDPSQMFHLRAVPDGTIGIQVDTRSVAPEMVQALRQHRSQWSQGQVEMPDDLLARSLRTEDWVIAWPPRAASEDRLTHLFEGLDSD